MAAAFFDEARVASVDPAIRVLRLSRLVGLLVVFDENAGGAVPDTHVAVDFQLDAGRRHADRICPHFAIRLRGDEDAGLRLAVELFQVHAERAVELKNLRPDRLTRSVAEANVRQAHRILQRPVNQLVADPVFQLVAKADRLSVQNVAADLLRVLHIFVKHALLGLRRVLHPDHHSGQQAFEDTRRGEEIGWPDLFQIVQHRLRAFRASH